MNVALPAATILLLLLPGVAAVQAFLGKFARRPVDPMGQTGVSWILLLSLLLAPPIHLLVNFLLVKLGAPPADLPAILSLIALSENEAGKSNAGLDAIARMPWHIVGHTLVATCAGLFLGKFFQLLIFWTRLDVKASWLRFGTHWYYLFNGRLRTKRGEIDFVYVAVTVQHGSECFIYMGALGDYFADASGTIQSIHLISAVRRPLANDEDPHQASALATRYYPIKGHELVVLGDDLRTINVHYITVKKRSSSAMRKPSAPPSVKSAQ